MKEKSTFLKWTALFVLVFTLSLPLTAKESFAGTMYTVSVSKGYLALRTAKAYDDKNEIGELYTGDTVEVTDTSDSTYWYVYSAKLNKSGYVNRNYLVGGGSSTGGSNYTVSVSKGYLALRTAKAYDDKNEIGELYSGDTVQVQDTSDSTYWYVYSPKLNKSGYVNRNYLVGGGTANTGGASYTVSVAKDTSRFVQPRHTMIRTRSENFTAEIPYRYRIQVTVPTGMYILRSLTNPAT